MHWGVSYVSVHVWRSPTVCLLTCLLWVLSVKFRCLCVMGHVCLYVCVYLCIQWAVQFLKCMLGTTMQDWHIQSGHGGGLTWAGQDIVLTWTRDSIARMRTMSAALKIPRPCPQNSSLPFTHLGPTLLMYLAGDWVNFNLFPGFSFLEPCITSAKGSLSHQQDQESEKLV